MTPKSIALTGLPSAGDIASVAFDFPFSGRAPNSLGSIVNYFYPINRLLAVPLASYALQWSDLRKSESIIRFPTSSLRSDSSARECENVPTKTISPRGGREAGEFAVNPQHEGKLVGSNDGGRSRGG